MTSGNADLGHGKTSTFLKTFKSQELPLSNGSKSSLSSYGSIMALCGLIPELSQLNSHLDNKSRITTNGYKILEYLTYKYEANISSYCYFCG